MLRPFGHGYGHGHVYGQFEDMPWALPAHRPGARISGVVRRMDVLLVAGARS